MADDQDKFTDSDPDAETIEPSPEQSRGGMPREIGQYKVRRVIGSGGMGTVYEAIQESPRRKVAIKVMRSGVTSRSAMRRFEYESQILGRLSHPCIAQVYEAGTHDDGSGGVPYFAMEYIVGARTLLDYAANKNLTIHQKLDLFEQVCDAVHHGHLKGIIHRDLKPDNILVDSSGNPKIIDFGVARSTDSDMVVTTLQTNVGQLIGTVQYMSPEQCEADPDLIDARSDVYSLGVILYELLTGQPPYNLSSIPIYEATRLIREQQPTKMTTIAEGIQGDLETIVSKAMDKDRDRRYQSSYELGQDITRYLENEPIHARRASIAYQFKMFARRNRGLVLGLATIAIVLIVATTVSVFEGVRASKAEKLAIVERDRAAAAEGLIKKEHEEAVAAKLEAEQAKSKLELSIQEVEQSASLLLELASFTEDLLSLGTPRNAQGKMLTTHDIALVATEEIDERFAEIPHLEFPSRRAIGELLWELGDLETAKEQLELAIKVYETDIAGLRQHEFLHTLYSYSRVLLDLGDFEKAREITEKLIDDSTDLFGSDYLLTLRVKDLYADILDFESNHEPALLLRREVVHAIEAGAKVSEEFKLEARVGLAESLYLSHQLSGVIDLTLPLLEESTKILESLLPVINKDLGKLHPVSIDARIILSGCLMHLMRIEESVPILEQVYEDAKKIYGTNHFKTGGAAGALGIVYYHRGIPEAESLLREAIKIYTEVLGTNHLEGINFRSMLGQLLVSQKRFIEAETILQKNMQDLPEGPSFPRTVTEGSLAHALMIQGKFEEGEPLWQSVVDDLLLAAAGEESNHLWAMRFIKAKAYILNAHPDADEVANDLISKYSDVQALSSPQCCVWNYHLVNSYFQTNQPDRGIEFANNLYDLIRSSPEVDDTDLYTVAYYESQLAKLCLEADRTEVALEILERVLPTIEAERGKEHEQVIELKTLLDNAPSTLGKENIPE